MNKLFYLIIRVIHKMWIENRNIKDVSTVCGKVYGHDSRHGALLQMKKSRLDLPTVETKADFLH